MAEVSTKTVNPIIPQGNPGLATTVLFVKGTTAATGDTLTVTGFTTVLGAYLSQANGTLPTSISIAGNVITINNAGGALTYSGLAWGT